MTRENLEKLEQARALLKDVALDVGDRGEDDMTPEDCFAYAYIQAALLILDARGLYR